MVRRRHARLVGERTPGVVGSSTPSERSAKWIKADDLRPAKEEAEKLPAVSPFCLTAGSGGSAVRDEAAVG